MRKLVTLLFAWALVACGSEGPAGPRGPQLRVIAGAGGTDTIESAPAQGLVVQVLGESGRPEAGVEVRFEAPVIDVGGRPARMSVSSVASPGFGSVAGATTDAEGRATVRVRYGTVAGGAPIVVMVPLYSLVDTARYTILPGAPVRVALSPRDTALAEGAGFTYRGSTVDRAGNARPDPGTFEAVGTAVSVTADGKVTAVRPGGAYVRLRAAIGTTTVVDSGLVTVVPAGQIAWSASEYSTGPLRLADLTGAGAKVLVSGHALEAAWAPDGSRLVYAGESGLGLVDVNGNATALATPGITSPSWPEFSADGRWIYFDGAVGYSSRTIHRIHPDGTGLETLLPASAGSAEMPSPSPDGRSVAYMGGGGALRVLDLATRSSRAIPNATGGWNPRWSPDGQWIAYVLSYASGELMLVHPDGSGLHRIGAHGVWPGITWSPDSKWLLGAENRGTLVDVTTGVMSYLPWTGRYPAWKR
ncbi:MAG TPA: hypothetical protein VFQ38_06960 [Longimicrobiales bacterium]|nr:hypothetical protein [Longimicrobiales bacterium]